jgi:hypothetical protein
MWATRRFYSLCYGLVIMLKGLVLFIALCGAVMPLGGQNANPHLDSKPQVSTTSIQEQQEPKSKSTSTRWYASSDWWLVVVGALTASVICWQSLETRRAAQASRDSITLVLSKERARLAIRVWRNLWLNQRDTIGERLIAPAVEFSVTNFGPTHAFNVRLFVSYLLTESDAPVSLPGLEEISMLSTMKANEKDVRPSFRPNVGDGLGNLGALVAGTKFLQLGGKLTYTDVFGEERETCFRFIHKIRNGRSEWKLHGLPNENEAT